MRWGLKSSLSLPETPGATTMRQTLLASTIVIGVTGGIAAAQNAPNPLQGQYAAPLKGGPAANNNNNSFGTTVSGPSVAPAPGTVVIRLNGRVYAGVDVSYGAGFQSGGEITFRSAASRPPRQSSRRCLARRRRRAPPPAPAATPPRKHCSCAAPSFTSARTSLASSGSARATVSAASTTRPTFSPSGAGTVALSIFTTR